jgi:DNA-binding transcriptional MerR regulator
MPQMSIGELSRRTGVKPTTIRWYESEGWLPQPLRTEAGRRSYGEAHLRRLGFLRHARELGFSMAHVRSLLNLSDRPGEDCEQVHTIATAHIEEIDGRVRRLLALRAELARMAGQCAGGHVGDCRIVETLSHFDHDHCLTGDHGAPRD